MIRVDTYKVAKYMRLSQEDGENNESQSIENQRDLLDSYIVKNDDLEVVDEYIDDGYTGGNFDRPQFKKMIENIEIGKINCIITKDLSRFGRDHIDTGYYLERYLPKRNVRYISIGDGIDTKDSKGLQFLTFKLSFNDYYIQDISNKIKSVKKSKMKNGEYQAGIPPYGYKKDPNKKNHLIIDEEVSWVIKEIFAMYANQGLSTIKIADELNRRKIVPSGVYLKIPMVMRESSKNPNKEYLWLRTQVGKILRNQVYLGHVVSGKKEQLSPKIKKGINKSKEEYIVVKNMHEPIISEELWNKVQDKLNSYNTNNKKKYSHPLEGLIYCGECEKKAVFQHNKSRTKTGKVWEGFSIKCSKQNNYISLCDNGLIGEKVVMNIVRKTITKEIKNSEYTLKELKEIYTRAERKANTQVKTIEHKIEENSKQLDKINSEISKIYSEKINKIISIEKFKELYSELNEKKYSLDLQIQNLKEEKKNSKQDNRRGNDKQVKRVVKEFLTMQNPSKEILRQLIERIEFDQEKNITIQLTFSNPDKKIM